MAGSKEQYDNQKENFSVRLKEIIGSKDKKYLNSFLDYLIKSSRKCKNDDQRRMYLKAKETIEIRGYLVDTDIAIVTGRNKSNISRWLNTQPPVIPNAQVITRLAQAFNVTTDYLLGMSASPDIEIEKEAKVFKDYKLSSKAFLAIKEFHDWAFTEPINENRVIDYEKAITGLNYLLEERNGNDFMDILVRIGYFLSRSRFDDYYYFDNDDVDNLRDSLTSEREELSPDYVNECINAFLNVSQRFSVDAFVLCSLDEIRDKLKAYKEKISPNFFASPENAPYFLPEPKQNSELDEEG